MLPICSLPVQFLLLYLGHHLPINNHRWDIGNLLIFSIGNAQNLHASRSDVVKEITTCTSLDLGRSSDGKHLKPLVGEGINGTSGTLRASQRKILAPEFHFDKVKVPTTEPKATGFS
nr:cytochrome P450 714B1-like isoform X2 [Nicotiana tomentosiformis]